MHLSIKSVQLLKSLNRSTLFKVGLDGDEIEIIEEADRVDHNLLLFGTDKLKAIELAASNVNEIDWLFFVDEGLRLEVIASPSDSYSDIEEIFGRIFTSEGFEKRSEQLKIANLIFKCFEDGKKGIIEAPTGTGKSLAYLVPSVIFAKKYRKKVVISTNTINLQRQLIEKDIPFLKQFIRFKEAIALGRGNYICRRKVENIFSKGDIFLFEGDAHKVLKDFLINTQTGLKSEFFSHWSVVDERLWGLVESSSVSCAHKKCPYYKNDCFFYRGRKKLDSADIVVANHHIVMSHSVMENSEILPEFYAIVFDEAHNIEKNATNYYTQTVSSGEIINTLNMLYFEGKKKNTGLLVGFKDSLSLQQEVKKTKELFLSEFDELSMRLKGDEQMLTKSNLHIFETHIKKIIRYLERLIVVLKDFLSRIDNDISVDLKGIVAVLSKYKNVFDIFLDIENRSEVVFWVKKFKHSIHFNITPLSIREVIGNYIYEKTNSVIFTSATLSVNGSFDFFKNTLGINGSVEFVARSGFDYRSNSRLFIVYDMPEPDRVDFPDSIGKVLVDIAEAIKDSDKMGVLVLFTSYRVLNRVYDLSKESISGKGFNLFRQGELDNFELLSRFKKGKGFLFATSSFWEGIDVKGDQLSVIVIVKLPFEVPTTPVEKARYEMLKTKGVNAFLEYSLPKAVIKFKQGLGRLIRKKDDRGIMVILDSRIFSKYYGRVFCDSVDYIVQERVKEYELKKAISDFFFTFA